MPGALAIIRAHQALEDLTLEREVAHHKPSLEQRWADLVYDGQWFSPLRDAIDAYVDATQAHVTRGRAAAVRAGRRARSSARGRRTRSTTCRSPRTAAEDAFDQSDSRGYVTLYGLPLKVWAATQAGA